MKKRQVRLLIFIINYQKYEEELRHLLQQNLSLSLRSSSALISEIEDQLTKCIYIYIYENSDNRLLVGVEFKFLKLR